MHISRTVLLNKIIMLQAWESMLWECLFGGSWECFAAAGWEPPLLAGDPCARRGVVVQSSLGGDSSQPRPQKLHRSTLPVVESQLAANWQRAMCALRLETHLPLPSILCHLHVYVVAVLVHVLTWCLLGATG